MHEWPINAHFSINNCVNLIHQCKPHGLRFTLIFRRELTLILRHSIEESDHRISVCGEITRSLEAKSWNEWDIERTAKYSLSFSRSLTDKIYTFSMIRVVEIKEFLSLCIFSEIIIESIVTYSSSMLINKNTVMKI